MEKQESEEERAELVRKMLTPEHRPTRDRWRDQHSPIGADKDLDKTMGIAKRFDDLEERIKKEEQLAEKVAELNAARWEKFENEIKEKLSLWLADINEPIWKEIEKLQERITEFEALVKGHPHDVKED